MLVACAPRNDKEERVEKQAFSGPQALDLGSGAEYGAVDLRSSSVNRAIKSVVFWLVIVVSAVLLWKATNARRPGQTVREISYSEFLSLMEAGNVSKVTLVKEQITGSFRNGEAFRLYGPESHEAMVQMLRHNHVEVWFGEEGSSLRLLLNLLPIILLVGLWAVMMRQIRVRRQQGNQAGPPPPIG